MIDRKVTANPFLTRIEKVGGSGHGNLSEKRVAQKLGARLQPASGALKGAKSDAKLKGLNYKFRIECKSTVNFTIPLQLDWLTKISDEAMSDASIPMVTLSFVTPEGKPRSNKNAEWVMIPAVFFAELKEKAECHG